MKKLLIFATLLLMLLGLSTTVKTANAETDQPTCDTGYHYVGNYEETETCETVCTRRIFGFCIRWEEQCTTTGEWVGECVADDVVTPPEEDATSTPAVFKPVYSDGLNAVLMAYCDKDERIIYSPWGDCLYVFGVQLRNITGTTNGCVPTVKQVVDQMRKCDVNLIK